MKNQKEFIKKEEGICHRKCQREIENNKNDIREKDKIEGAGEKMQRNMQAKRRKTIIREG